jgi:hypothetical protein
MFWPASPFARSAANMRPTILCFDPADDTLEPSGSPRLAVPGPRNNNGEPVAQALPGASRGRIGGG